MGSCIIRQGHMSQNSRVWLVQAKMYATGNELDLCIRLYEALHAVHGSSGSAPFMIGEPWPDAHCCGRLQQCMLRLLPVTDMVVR